MIDRNELHKMLSKRDAICLLSTIDESVRVKNEEDFRLLIARLQDLIYFESSLCFLGKTDGQQIRSIEFININYPAEVLELYFLRSEHLIDPIASKNFQNFGLQYWRDTLQGYRHPTDFRGVLVDYGIVDGYTVGVRNYKSSYGSAFTFSGERIRRDPHAEIILELLAPHLHQALQRIGTINKNNGILLSVKEQEVLKWLKQGKNTWDVSVILGISERTVKFHVGNIMRKLDASTRTHAVAIAIEQGLLDIE